MAEGSISRVLSGVMYLRWLWTILTIWSEHWEPFSPASDQGVTLTPWGRDREACPRGANLNRQAPVAYRRCRAHGGLWIGSFPTLRDGRPRSSPSFQEQHPHVTIERSELTMRRSTRFEPWFLGIFLISAPCEIGVQVSPSPRVHLRRGVFEHLWHAGKVSRLRNP